MYSGSELCHYAHIKRTVLNFLNLQLQSQDYAGQGIDNSLFTALRNEISLSSFVRLCILHWRQCHSWYVIVLNDAVVFTDTCCKMLQSSANECRCCCEEFPCCNNSIERIWKISSDRIKPFGSSSYFHSIMCSFHLFSTLVRSTVLNNPTIIALTFGQCSYF